MNFFIIKTKYQNFLYGLSLPLVLIFGIFLVTNFVNAAPNYKINYQGKLTDENGVTVANGTYNMRFWLLTTQSIATTSAVWTESLTSTNRVQVTNGLFSVMLGSTSAMTSVNFNQTLYLGVEIGGTGGSPTWDGEMSPRKVLGAVPAAFEAKNASTVGGVASTSFLRSDQADTASSLITFTSGLVSSASSSFTAFNATNATTTNLRLTGRFRDSTNSAGVSGYVLRSTATSTRWVATSTLGFSALGSTINVTELASEDFGNFTCNGTSCTIDNTSLTAGMIANGDHGFFSYSAGVASLDANGLTSANLTSALSDETGTNRAVFSGSPAFSGTATFASLTATGTATFSTVDINGGAIDGSTIGAASASSIIGTTIQANTGFTPDADDGAYLGQSGTAFSDLFLASGGVINWNTGDVTLTHSADTLTVAGGTLAIATGTVANKLTTSGTVLASAGVRIGADNTNNLIDDASTGAGSATLYIGNESILASGDIGVSVQGYNANTSILGSTIAANELADGDFGSFTVATGVATIDNNAITPDMASSTGQVDEYCLTYESTGDTWAWQSCGAGGLLSTDIDTSSELAAILTDETGTNRAVFSNAPAFSGTATFASLTATGTASTTNLVVSNTATTTNLRLTGRFRDSTNSAGVSGYVLRSTATSTRWVATSTLGFSALGSTINVTELASEDFGNFTCNGTSCTIDNTSLTAGMIANGDHGFFSYSAGVASLDANGLTSANLTSALSDETGTNRAVFSGSPAFSGTATFASLTATGTATFSTVDINGGAIDGSTIGAASASSIIGTTIQANTGFTPDADDGAYLGQSGTAFSDLFLASGGVINWNTGDVTLTHSADTLTVAGGTLAIATGTVANKLTTSGTVLASAGVRIGADNTNNLIDDASTGAGSATLYIGNESILASGDIGVSVQGYNANTSILGSTIAANELADGDFGSFTVATGVATIDNNAITPDMASSTGQVDEYCLTYESTGDTWAWQSCGAGGLLSTDIDTSSELAAILTDETGTNRAVFSNAPAFSGTATFASLTATGTATFSTVDINGGAIDGSTIGAASASSIIGTTIQANTGFTPDADDGAYLGQSGTAFSDLFLASGGVINWNTGDVTLTHSADTLTVAGGTLAIATGTVANKLTTSGTVLASAGVRIGADNTNNLIDDASTGAGSATLYIGNESILASGDIGVSVQGYNANTSILGSTIAANELADGDFGSFTVATGVATIDNNAITPDMASSTGQVDEYCLTYESTGDTWAWQSCGAGGLLSTDIDTSSELAAILTDETGTNRAVFSGSPAFSGTATFASLTATGTASTTNLVVSNTATTTNLRLTGRFRDSTNSAGVSGYVLRSTATSTRWVATSTLGFSALGSTINVTELASEDFGNFTCNGTSCTIDNTSLTAGMIANGDHGFFSYSAGVASLDTGGLTSANLTSALTDETGTNRAVFSGSPAFSGTATFASLTATGTASTTNLVVSNTATTTNLRLTGRFRDSTNSAGVSGYVLRSTATSTRWVATSTLGFSSFGASVGPTEMQATDFGDWTCNGTVCSLDSDTVADSEIDYANVTLADFTNDANFLTNISAESFDDLSDVDLTGAAASNILTRNSAGNWVDVSTSTFLMSTELDSESELETQLGSIDVVTVTASDITSANLATILSDETGTNRAVFAGSPAFSGTATFSALTATSTLIGQTTIQANTGFIPDADGGAYLGQGTTAFSGLFLDTAGTINFDNSDVLITHSANDLAFTGVTGDYSFDDAVVPSANDAAALGVSGTAWSDLFLATGAVVNFAASDVTLTHSADTLTVAGGTLSLATSTQSGRLTLSGAAANIALGSNYLSGDGDDEGISVDSTGRVGIGSSTPASRLSVVTNVTGSVMKLQNQSVSGWTSIDYYDSSGVAVTSLGYGNSSASVFANTSYLNSNNSRPIVFGTNGSEKLRLTTVGDLGIGTTSPNKRLTVLETVADDQFRISYDADDYADFQVDSTGDLIIDAEGGDVILADESLQVCSGGSCPSTPAQSGTGNLTIENELAIGTSTARTNYQAELQGDLYVAGGNATGLGQSTSTFQGDVMILGKLDVGTIDPIYRIGGVKYATYGLSAIGVKEETAETFTVSEFNSASGYYEKQIAWNELPQASDLWLFHNVTDFGLLWEYLTVSLTAGFDGRVFYKKDVANNALLIQATAPGEVSARFMANRFDWSKWGNVRPDQDGAAHFELEEKE